MKKGILLFLLMFITSGSSLNAQAGGTDYIICIDNGESMTDARFNEVKLTASKLAERLLSCNPKNRYAVVHYGNAVYNASNSSYKPRIYIESDFGVLSWPEQYFKRKFEGASYFHESLGLIGNALDDIDNADIISPQKVLNRDPGSPLVVILFTNASRNVGNMQNGSYLVNDLDTALNSPGAFKNVTNFKVDRGAKFAVIHMSTDNQSVAAAASIASKGGSYSGNVESNTADPDYGILPRLYSQRTYSLGYDSVTEMPKLEEIVSNICDPSGWAEARFFYEPKDCGVHSLGFVISASLSLPPGAVLKNYKLVTRDIVAGIDYGANFNPTITNGNQFFQELQFSDLNLPPGATSKYKFILAFQYELGVNTYQVDVWNYYPMFEYDINLGCTRMTSQMSAEIKGTSIQLAPNPTNGESKVLLKDGFTSGLLQVLDVAGREVYGKSFKNERQIEINLNFQPAGIYIVKIVSDKNEVYTQKLIKK
jgi:hypothetical protein